MYLQDYLASAYQNFIVPKYITAPNTTIINRALVLDTANMLQVVGPNERILFRSLAKLSKEIGANGEPVWEADNKD